ncbi:MAG: phosphoribosyl-ATP diphosphatase [SAR324 cluster bacterium]|uniref:Phosphoribosyl-ATP pyrophosphatase n=1 Tax=SAR324 cluster bacterium TaxID=2024889 RepID=A0A2D6YLU5_9DELT|nr:phosphoribosyl-ATP diphosphatase [SAR324 cluster bacterium]
MKMLSQVLETIHQRIASGDTNSSYVASLVQKGEDRILKKIAEEATEVVLAAKGNDRAALVHELTDLWFHCLVLMAEKEISLLDIDNEFLSRFGQSGIEEKASRN